MVRADQAMIVGAGPVGLGAALFLARQGQVPRVVEMRDRPAQQSKALAVNPRTLDLLEPTGVTRQMLELGLPIHEVRFYRRGRVVGGMSLAGIHPRYPYMLGLSQAVTERLLAQALEAAGGRVERGVKLVACRNLADGVEVRLELTAGGLREVAWCPWLLAADGAHSTVRQQLGIGFVGSSFAHEWYLADAPLRTSLAEDQAHVFFLDGGAFLFLLRVVEDAQPSRPGGHSGGSSGTARSRCPSWCRPSRPGRPCGRPVSISPIASPRPYRQAAFTSRGTRLMSTRRPARGA